MNKSNWNSVCEKTIVPKLLFRNKWFVGNFSQSSHGFVHYDYQVIPNFPIFEASSMTTPNLMFKAG